MTKIGVFLAFFLYRCPKITFVHLHKLLQDVPRFAGATKFKPTTSGKHAVNQYI